MKIEQLPHIDIQRTKIDEKGVVKWYYSEFSRAFVRKNKYIPRFCAMADSYQMISRLLDTDCVVAYVTDKSQTTFLIKTRQQYVAFICISEKLATHLISHSTRTITRIYNKNGFLNLTKDEDLIVADKDKWDKYIKTKLLESLE